MTLHALIESLRCLKHNVVDRRSFSISFVGGYYEVTTADGIHLRFRHNPYLALYQALAGYLRDSNSTLRPGMHVIDAGACDGEFALYASRRVGPTGKVIALEPDPANFERLRETFELNGGVPAWVELVRAGLWNAPGERAFAATNYLASHFVDVESSTTQRDSDCQTVPVESLASLVSRFRLRRLDFVKMDIEGAEIEALEDAADVLSTFQPAFAIASYHLRNGQPTAHRLEELFRKAKYAVATAFPVHLTTYATPPARA